MIGKIEPRTAKGEPVPLLRRLWWRIAGAPELWEWPRQVEHLWQLDPVDVQQLKARLDLEYEDEVGTLWWRDRYTGQMWRQTVSPWEMWDLEKLTPVGEEEKPETSNN